MRSYCICKNHLVSEPYNLIVLARNTRCFIKVTIFFKKMNPSGETFIHEYVILNSQPSGFSWLHFIQFRYTEPSSNIYSRTLCRWATEGYLEREGRKYIKIPISYFSKEASEDLVCLILSLKSLNLALAVGNDKLPTMPSVDFIS